MMRAGAPDRPGAALWLLGAAGSLAAHAVLAWVVAMTLRPDPVPYKEPPRAKISVLAHEGRVERVRPSEAEGAAAAEAAPEPGRTGVAQVPHSSVGAVAGKAEAAATQRPDAAQIAPAAPVGASATQVSPGRHRVAAASPEPAAIAPAAARFDSAARPVEPAAGRGRVAEPTGAALQPSTAAAARAQAVVLERETVAPASTPAPAPDIARVTAALAEHVRPASQGASANALAPAAQESATIASASAETSALRPAGPSETSRLNAADGLAGAQVVETAELSAADGVSRPSQPVAVAPAAAVAASGGGEHAEPTTPPEPDRLVASGAAGNRQTVAATRPAAGKAHEAETAATAAVLTPDRPKPQATRPARPPRAGRLAGAGERLAALAVPAVARPAADSADARQAALAWSGGADTRLDPQSLAAIQSFMAPTPAGGAPSVRDGLDATLSGLPCSRLTAAFAPGSGEIAVRGHARDRAIAAEAVERVRAAVGASIPVVGDILILPEPQCGVLERVEALGLPQSADQTDDPLVVGRAAQARYLPLEEGEPMAFALEAADYDAYIHVDYFDAAGSVTHLAPNEYAPLSIQPAGRRFAIGAGGADGSGMRLTIAPPFGKEIVTVIAATHPLHRGQRPLTEDGAAYLAVMRDRIAELRVTVPGFRGEWAYMFLETFPRGGRPAR